MSRKKMLDTNGAVAEALRLARLQVFASNPPCPGEPVAACLASYAAEGDLAVKFMPADSEQTALICAVGAQLSGIRACATTSSLGLRQMHEACAVAASLRAPVVMPVLNQPAQDSMVVWGHFQDAMSERDGGWLQFYAADCQEMIDLLLMAFRIAEDRRVCMPAMVCLDGFFLDRATEAVELPSQESIDRFLPPCGPKDGAGYLSDRPKGDKPVFPLDEYSEIRYWQSRAFAAAGQIIPLVMNEYAGICGRAYRPVEGYRIEDAEAVLVVMGSVGGAVKYVVDRYRQGGFPVGMVKVVSFRPFPALEVAELLAKPEKIGVLDRSTGLGGVSGPFCADVRAAVGNYGSGVKISSFLAGIGGREVSIASITKVFDFLMNDGLALTPKWVDIEADSVLSMYDEASRP